MNLTRSNLAWILTLWLFAILLGLAFSFNVPLVLLIIITVLLLIG
jgi:hypothetical protein